MLNSKKDYELLRSDRDHCCICIDHCTIADVRCNAAQVFEMVKCYYSTQVKKRFSNRSVFFFLTECWYLVTCEDDCNLRVLHEDEVQHIFPEDNEEELQVGDVVSALWLPNDQYYDAKVLQKGAKQRFSLFLIIEIFPDKFIQPLIKRRVPPTVLIKH